MRNLQPTTRASAKIALLAGLISITLVGCESDGGTGSPGIGTVAGAAAGAGAGRALFGSSPAGMLIGGAVGGLAGNMTLDRPAETRRQQEQEAARDAEMQRQLDFERQRALQAAEVEREIEERRLFEEWQRERAAQQG
jgi:Glycine zipper 2TM domain